MLSPEEKVARIKEFTSWIRKVIDTKTYNDSKAIDEEMNGKECVRLFTEFCVQVAGNKGRIDLNDAKDAYLLVEAITRWSYKHLSFDKE